MTTRASVELTAGDRTAHQLNKAMSSPEIVAVARVLQRLAFEGMGYDDKLRELVPNFDPAPMYLAQASAIAREEKLAVALLEALDKIIK